MKRTAIDNSQAFAVDQKLQYLFVVSVVLAFMAQLSWPFIYTFNQAINWEYWSQQLVLVISPLLFFIIALLMVWRRYQIVLQRLFIACVLAVAGVLLFGVARTVEVALQMRLYPPGFDPFVESSWWAQHAKEVYLLAVGLLLYAVLIRILIRKKR